MAPTAPSINTPVAVVLGIRSASLGFNFLFGLEATIALDYFPVPVLISPALPHGLERLYCRGEFRHIKRNALARVWIVLSTMGKSN